MCAFAPELRAGLNRWTPLGPYTTGGYVGVIITAKTGEVLAGGYGISISRDRGATWLESANLAQRIVTSIAVDPRSASSTYAGTTEGLFGSTDGALHWLPLPLGGFVQKVAVDPNDSRTLYARIFQSGLFKSIDSGETWTLVFPGGFDLAIAATVPSTIYVSTPSGVSRSGDAGVSWAAVANELPPGGVEFLTVDPATPTTIYGAGAGAVYRSTDGGSRWTVFQQGLPTGHPPGALAISRGSSGTLYASFSGRIFRSDNGAALWREVSDLSGQAYPQTLAVDPTYSNVVYAGTYENGLLRSEDGGRTWTSEVAFQSLKVADLEVKRTAPFRLFAVGDQGVFQSADRGASWSGTSSGLPPLPVTSIALSPVVPGGESPAPAYVGVSGSGVFGSLDGGFHWMPRGTLPDPHVVSLASSASALFAGTGQGIYRSTNAGQSWTAGTGLSFGASAIVADPLSTSILYAGSNRGIVKSADGGSSWNLIFETPNFVVSALAIAPGAPSRVFAGTTYVGPGFEGTPVPGDVFRSDDGGATWRTLGGLPDLSVSSLAIDPSNPARIFAGLRTDSHSLGGVFWSRDAGESWERLGEDLSYPAGVSVLAVDPQPPLRVYAGTYGRSVFEYTFADESCIPGPTTLCLSGGRFRVEVTWKTGPGPGSAGRTMPLTSHTGAFWFFQPSNIELVVKVLDGRSINGKFWVFYGALSNVEYTIRVTDTLTAEIRTYFNPQGTLASVADTDAF